MFLYNSLSKKYLGYVVLVETVLILGFGAYMWNNVARQTHTEEAKGRDAIRLDDISNIRIALREYASEKGHYPSCLYAAPGCSSSLGGSDAMSVVPTDPLTESQYSYAAFGSGSACNSYHVGSSLERTASQALLLGSDATPEPDENLCKGSAPDFSGLSFANGGMPCDLSVGVPQPTDKENGETCFDVKPRSPLSQ